MNMQESESVIPSGDNDVLKVSMLLKEAELFGHDVHFLSLASSPQKGQAYQAASAWAKSDDNMHTGSLSVYLRDGLNALDFDGHGQRSFSSISPNIKVKEISEILVLGNEVAVINVLGYIQTYRDKRIVTSCMRVLNTLSSITRIEKMKGFA